MVWIIMPSYYEEHMHYSSLFSIVYCYYGYTIEYFSFFLKAINYKDNKIFLKNAKIINDIDVIV